VAIFAGEAMAGEAAWGSLRYLLVGARSRTKVFWSKTLVAAGFSVTAVAVTAGASLLAGLAAFGWLPLTVIDLEHTTAFHVAAATYAPAAALGRLAAAAGVVLVSMASTFGFGLLLSTLTRSPFSALAGAVGLGLVSRALDNVPGLSSLGPWLPLTDAGTTQWTGLFVQPPNLGSFGHLALVQAVYLAVFVGAAWIRFARADVLT
jgi:ABC-2 type transport system permease protein